MADPVRDYLRQIGAKGGAAGRGPSKARSSEQARAAVQARWAKAKRAKKRKTGKPNKADSLDPTKRERIPVLRYYNVFNEANA